MNIASVAPPPPQPLITKTLALVFQAQSAGGLAIHFPDQSSFDKLKAAADGARKATELLETSDAKTDYPDLLTAAELARKGAAEIDLAANVYKETYPQPVKAELIKKHCHNAFAFFADAHLILQMCKE